jgi:hypothetical protein
VPFTVCVPLSPLLMYSDEEDSPSRRRPLLGAGPRLGAGMFDAVRSALTDTYTQAQLAVGAGGPARGSRRDDRAALPPLAAHTRKVSQACILANAHPPLLVCRGLLIALQHARLL